MDRIELTSKVNATIIVQCSTFVGSFLDVVCETIDCLEQLNAEDIEYLGIVEPGGKFKLAARIDPKCDVLLKLMGFNVVITPY